MAAGIFRGHARRQENLFRGHKCWSSGAGHGVGTAAAVGNAGNLSLLSSTLPGGTDHSLNSGKVEGSRIPADSPSLMLFLCSPLLPIQIGTRSRHALERKWLFASEHETAFSEAASRAQLV